MAPPCIRTFVIGLCVFFGCVTVRADSQDGVLPYMSVANRLGWQPPFEMQALEKILASHGSSDLWITLKGAVLEANDFETGQRVDLQARLAAINGTGQKEELVIEYLVRSYDRASKFYSSVDELITNSDRKKIIEAAGKETFNFYDPLYHEYLEMSSSAKAAAMALLPSHARKCFASLKRRQKSPSFGPDEGRLFDLRLKWELMADFLALLDAVQQRHLLMCTLQLSPAQKKDDLKTLLDSQLARRLPSISSVDRKATIDVLLKAIKIE